MIVGINIKYSDDGSSGSGGSGGGNNIEKENNRKGTSYVNRLPLEHTARADEHIHMRAHTHIYTHFPRADERNIRWRFHTPT